LRLATGQLDTSAGASAFIVIRVAKRSLLDHRLTLIRVQRDLVLRGLAENPAVPVDVLVRLPRDWPEPVAEGLHARVDLPVSLQERMANHEMRRVRAAVARHERLDPVIGDRLLNDPDWRVRLAVFLRPSPASPPTRIRASARR
jgi:hypothetical protein